MIQQGPVLRPATKAQTSSTLASTMTVDAPRLVSCALLVHVVSAFYDDLKMTTTKRSLLSLVLFVHDDHCIVSCSVVAAAAQLTTPRTTMNVVETPVGPTV